MPISTITPKPNLSTMWAPDDNNWNSQVEVLPFRTLGPRDVRNFLRKTRQRRAVILLGSIPAASFYRDLVLAIVAKVFRRNMHIVISDATWEPRSRALEKKLPLSAGLIKALARWVIRAIDSPQVVYGVLSSDEVKSFTSLWNVPPERVKFTMFSHTMHAESSKEQIRDDGYLFAGGNSMRDYPLLYEALRTTGGVPTRLATSWKRPDLPDWLRAERVPQEEFVDWLCGCRASIVPLVNSVRSAGQQTYLNSMLVGKPTIVTDTPGVKDYVEHGVTGIVVPRSPGAIAEAVQFVMDPQNNFECQAMGARARAWVLNNATPNHYRQRLLDLAYLT